MYIAFSRARISKHGQQWNEFRKFQMAYRRDSCSLCTHFMFIYFIMVFSLIPLIPSFLDLVTNDK